MVNGGYSSFCYALCVCVREREREGEGTPFMANAGERGREVN